MEFSGRSPVTTKGSQSGLAMGAAELGALRETHKLISELADRLYETVPACDRTYDHPWSPTTPWATPSLVPAVPYP